MQQDPVRYALENSGEARAQNEAGNDVAAVAALTRNRALAESCMWQAKGTL